MKDAEDITHRLRRALRAAGHPAVGLPLEHLRDKGLAHDHVRLVGSGLLARVPKQSQMGLGAVENLTYQRACFERAAAGGHAPAWHGELMPSTDLPRGALLVQEISGRPAQLPADLGAIAAALAALHSVPLPRERAPLLSPADPLLALCREITTQMEHLPAARLPPSVMRMIETEWRDVQTLLASPARPPQCLIAFDAHPGNFILQADGRAVLVDLEKCRYAYPGLDLAHATLYTSTTWDVDARAELTSEQVGLFYAAWSQATGAAAEGASVWHVPLRRAMWLWSLSWCAKWRAMSGAAASLRFGGEDWSSEHSEASLVTHVRDRVDHYLSEPIVSKVRDELAALERGWSA